MTTPHIVLTPVGSSGDVHPFVGIGRALRERGHDVTVVTAGPFRSVVERSGLRFVEHWSEAAFEDVTRDPDLWHRRRGLGVVLRAAAEELRQAYRRLAELYEPGRTMLVGHTLSFATRVFEESHSAPAATVHLAPAVFRTNHRLPIHEPGWDLSALPRPLKRALWWLIDRSMVDPHLAPGLNRWRHELGLPPVSHPFKDWIHSPQATLGLFPEWFGPRQPDWPASTHQTGFVLFDDSEGHTVPTEVQQLLDSGEAPVVFTPGSANRHASAFFRAASDATATLGRPALLLTGYPEPVPARLPDHVTVAPYVPLSRVLARCAAIVHHGGIGTCAQGLAAGVPQLVMPMAFDQPDNAARLERLGVGTWITPRRFTARHVAPTLGRLLDDRTVAAACERWRRVMADASPIVESCEIIERVLDRHPSRRR